MAGPTTRDYSTAAELFALRFAQTGCRCGLVVARFSFSLTSRQMVTLRDYQERAVQEVLAAAARGVRRVFFTMPTGCGKTVTFVALHSRLPGDGPTLVLAHRDELLEQAKESFKRTNPNCVVQVEQGDQRASPDAEVIVASVQTLGRPDCTRLSWLQPKLIVVDEAHHAVAPGYVRVLQRFGCFEARGPVVCGVTATPKRLDRHSLESVFQEQVFVYPIREAIEAGWLCDIRGVRVYSSVSLDGVGSTAGDFNQNDLAKRVNVEPRTRAAIVQWRQIAGGCPSIVFCADVAHAESAAEMWRDYGFAAECIHGELPRDERKAALKRFKTGDTQVLTNVQVLTEGFDHPPTGCVVMLRPTQSWSLYCQMAGRGTRPYPGKEHLWVIDVVDNCRRHSLATLPALLDLPPNLNLEGHSLPEAARKLDELGERVSYLADYAPDSWSELEIVVDRINLFAAVEAPEEVQANCALSWLKIEDGVYLLDGGGGERRVVWAVSRPPGEWLIRMASAGAQPHELVFSHPTERMGDVLQYADRVIAQRWPACVALARRAAPWRQQLPSEKQLAMLKQKGYPDAAIRRLNKGQVANLLTATFRERETEILTRAFRNRAGKWGVAA